MRMLSTILLGLTLALTAPACGGDEGTGGGGTTGTDAGTSGADGATGGADGGSTTSDSGTTTDAGEVTCTPDCDDKECGDDGCGGTCGTCDLGPGLCGDDGMCMSPCMPECLGNCGDDGCGGSCGTCDDPNTTCVNSNCCTPDCGDKTCGNDGCGGSCGQCPADEQCVASVCEAKAYTCSELFGMAQEIDCDWSADSAGCQGSIVDAYEASDEESASLTALLACLDTNLCGVTQSNAQASCQKEHCLDQTVACEASQHGALMCFEITQCIEDAACPKDIVSGAPTAACRRQCLEQGSEKAVEFWMDLELCALAACLGEADFDQCSVDVTALQCITEHGNCYDEAQQ